MMMYAESCENKFDSWSYYNDNNVYLSQLLKYTWHNG